MSTLSNDTNIETPVAPDVSIATIEQDETSILDAETANALQTRSTGKNVARATAGIVPLQVLRLVMGFITQPMIGHIFGLGDWRADSYTVSLNVQEKIWLVFEKVVNPAVLPCFMKALDEDGEERAWRFTSTVITLTAIALLVATLLGYAFMPQIIGIYSNKTAQFPERLALTVSLARLMLAGLCFLGMSSLTYVILNGYKRFMLAALGDALWKAGILIGVVLAIARHAHSQDALKYIALGFIAGAFLKLFPHLVGLREKWKLFRPNFDFSDPLVRKMGLLAIPLIAGIFISEARDIYMQRLADDPSIQIAAGRTALKFSRLIGTNLIQIFPYALSIGIFPYLADLARARDRQPLTDTLLGALRICIFTFAPLTLVLIALRFPLLRAVWQSGNFTLQDTHAISAPFVAVTLGLVAFSCEMMLNQTFYAMTNAWTPTLIGIGTSALWVLVAVVGVQNGFGLAAIAGAETVAKTTKCILMWLWLRPHLGEVKIKEQILFWAKVLLGSIVAALVAGFLAQHLAGGDLHGKLGKIKMLLGVTASGGVGVLAYLALCALLQVREVQLIGEFAGKIKKRIG